MLLGVVALGGACSGDDDATEPARGGTQPGGEPVEPVYAFTVTGTEVQAMAPQAPPFPEDLVAGVKAGLDAYLGVAVVNPLLTGQPASGLEAAFTAASLARLANPGVERAAVLEEGAPLTGEVEQQRADAKLTALTAPGGDVVLVTAQVDMGHTVDAGDSNVEIVRSGELVFVADAGAWRIDAFNMRTARDTR